MVFAFNIDVTERLAANQHRQSREGKRKTALVHFRSRSPRKALKIRTPFLVLSNVKVRAFSEFVLTVRCKPQYEHFERAFIFQSFSGAPIWQKVMKLRIKDSHHNTLAFSLALLLLPSFFLKLYRITLPTSRCLWRNFQ